MASLKPAVDGAVPSSKVPLVETALSLPAASHSVVIAGATPPSSPLSASVSSPSARLRPRLPRAPPSFSTIPAAKPPGSLYPPATGRGVDYNGESSQWEDSMGESDMVLELADGLALAGHSFGAEKSTAGECVFQTGELVRLGVAKARHGRLSRIPYRSFVLIPDPHPHLPTHR